MLWTISNCFAQCEYRVRLHPHHIPTYCLHWKTNSAEGHRGTSISHQPPSPAFNLLGGSELTLRPRARSPSFTSLWNVNIYSKQRYSAARPGLGALSIIWCRNYAVKKKERLKSHYVCCFGHLFSIFERYKPWPFGSQWGEFLSVQSQMNRFWVTLDLADESANSPVY